MSNTDASFFLYSTMTSIYKLAVHGVRSFGGDSEEVVQFGTPLTLIVGHNGSGKTSIIEALRYATTGEVPPNTNKGVSFVTDPHLGAGRETMAHIKLAFKTFDKKQMILTKNMSVAVNNRTKGLSFKTRENQLKAIDSYGNKETMSSKVADVEKLIPQLLGVNKAVLEYVVFCHQEESLWPISDSASLKKKFDEIFDSVKFIDALRDMKEISKRLNVEIKELTLIVSHLLEDKKRYLKKLSSIKDIEGQMASIETEIVTMENHIQHTNTQLNDLHNSNQDFEQVLSRMQTLTQQRDSIEQNIQRIESTTETIHLPQEELQRQLNDFVNVVATQRVETESLKDDIKRMRGELDQFRADLDTMLIEAGKFQADKEKYEKDKLQKQQLISENSSVVQAESITEFDMKLKKKISEMEKILAQRTAHYDTELSTLSSQLLDINKEITKENQHQSYLNEDISSQEAKKIELQNRLVSISNNQTMLKTLREELVERDQLFSTTNPQSEIEDINAQLATLQKITLPQYELELERCQDNMKLSRGNAEISSKIVVLQDQNKTAMRYLTNLKESMQKEFPGFDFTDELVLQSKLRKLDYEREQAKKEIDTATMKLSELKYTLSNNEIKLKDSNILLKKIRQNTNNLNQEYQQVYKDKINFDKFDSEVERVEESFDNEIKMVKFKEFLIDYYKTAIKYAQDEGACRLCNTQLHEDGQDEEDELFYRDFIKRLEGLQLKYEKQTEGAEELEQKKSVLGRMRNAKHEINQLTNLERDISTLEADIKNKKEEIADREASITETTQKMDAVSTELKKWKLHSEDIKSISRVQREISDREAELERLSAQLSLKGLNVTSEELEAEHKRLTFAMKSTRAEIETLRNERDQKQIQKTDALNSLNELKLKINDLELKSMDKLNIEKAIDETDEQLLKLKAVLEKSEQTLVELKERLIDMTTSKESIDNKKTMELEKLDTDLNQFTSIKDIFKKVNESIDEYERNQGDSKHEKCQTDVRVLKAEISAKEELIAVTTSNLQQLEMNLANSNNQERTIRFNIDLIQYKAQLAEITEEIGTVDIEQAQLKKSEYLLKSTELQQTQIKYQKDIAGRVGERTQLEKQIESIKNEIDRDYNNIDKRHAEKFMELQTKLALATDLSTCYKATDDSILKYHLSQMDKINNIIDELWKKTYMGNDIETIQIKSDPIAAKTKATTTAKNNRSYNYRVVMYKNGNELDMRGRCSAGQKVLASIIIRIALAECFGTSFGMITLDEPTTNLDEENIESLARALHKIIRDRMEQRNFQLIIITHDEKFLRMLNAVDFTDYYYKVQRNERLNSVISKVKINSITN